MPVDWDELPSPTQEGSSDAVVDNDDVFGIDRSRGTFKGGLWKTPTKPSTISTDMPLDVLPDEVEVVEILPITGPPGPVGPPGPPGTPGAPGSTGTVQTFIALESLNGHFAVRLVGTGVKYADSTISTSLGSFVGITSSASPQGELATVVTVGLMVEPSWSWIPDRPIYFGAGGFLTQTVPALGNNAYTQQVAYASSATSIFVLPQPPISF